MIGRALKQLAQVAGLFACWALWIALVFVLGAQLTVASRRQMAVPRPVLAALEQRLLVAGMRADFGRTRFDPTGRVLIEDLRLRFAGFEDPVITARSVILRVNLVALLAGRVEPKEIRIGGLAARVPAMLSPSGTADEVLANADVDLLAGPVLWRVLGFSGRIGGIDVAGQGAILIPSAGAGRAPVVTGDQYARRYAEWTRRAAAAFAMLGALEKPQVRFTLVPTPGGATRIDFAVTADRLRLSAPVAFAASDLRLTGTWPLAAEPGSPIEIRLEAARAALRGTVALVAIDAALDGRLAASGEAEPVAAEHLRVTARRLTTNGVDALAPVVSLELAGWPQVAAAGSAWVFGEPIRFRASADVNTLEGTVAAAGRLSPAALPTLERWKSGLGAVIRWDAPIEFDGAARFGPKAQWESAAAWIHATGVTARTVRVDELIARVEVDSRGLRAPTAYARLSESEARGSFEQDRAGDYRFLLQGRLQPLAITPWIAGAWWKDFFRHFDFAAHPPDANMDLRGSWTNGRQARVFLRVDAPDVAFDGVPFQALHGVLFARPQFTDALDFSVQRAGGTIAGTFSRRYNFAAGAWSRLDLQLDSSVDPAPVLRLLGPEGEAAVSGISFPQPPAVHFSGTFTGPGDPAGSHRDVHLNVRSPELAFHGIGFSDVHFAARLQDDDLTLESADAAIAGGRGSGSARLFGPPAARRIAFDLTLTDVSLPHALATAASFAGKTSGVIKSGAAVKLFASARAEGRFGDPYSFEGAGQLDLHGGEIGELHMLGALSQLLRFTALRFTAASAGFKVQGRRLLFPTVEVIGANSAIAAHGTCDLEDGELDFRARLNPFQQSHSFPQKFMDLVLTPISDVLEVRLTGTVNKPLWAFVNGPTNLLRSLGPPNGVAPAR